MKLCIALIVVASMVAAGDVPISAQTSKCRKPELQRYVYERSARPKSEVAYARAVKFKLGSRKSIYRRGEMITLDLGMLNVSGRNLFLHNMVMPSISFTVHSDDDAHSAAISPYILILEGVVPQSYQYIGKDKLLTGSFQILVDCSFKATHDKLLDQLPQAQANNSDIAAFERDLFVSWGDACLSLPRPGRYTITAEMSNEFVISSACEPLAKTAVGTIVSSSLSIVIEE